MCYNASYYELKLDKIEKHYGGLTYDKSIWADKAAYNVSGFTNPMIPTISSDKPHEVLPRVWGFHPHFAKKPQDIFKYGGGLINVRDDKLKEKIKSKAGVYLHKGMIDKPVVIFLNGFIEWHTLTKPKLKVPYYHGLKDGEMMAVAGVSTTFSFFDKPEEKHEGVVLMTTSANSMVGQIHNLPAGSSDLRMPALLTADEIKTWLDTSINPIERLDMFTPYPSEEMEAHSIPNFLKKDGKHFYNIIEGLEPHDYEREGAPVYIDGANCTELN